MHTLTVDVSSSVNLPGPLHITASVFLPAASMMPTDPLIVVFAVPGGGYARGYYDIHAPGHGAYSQAEHHAARGFLFIACDHLGVGDSSLPDPGRLTLDILAASYAAAVRALLQRIGNGTLIDGLPARKDIVAVGIGQSMGGAVTIVTQGQYAVFDAVAPLGYSAIHTVLPQRSDAARAAAIAGHTAARDTDPAKISLAQASATIADYVYPFHWEDVPADILDADMRGGYPVRKTTPPWGSLTLPPCAVTLLTPGVVAREAAAIRTPVFIGLGERDTAPEPHREPAAFSNSRDITLFVVPRMAHMHNFASTRALLWQRLADWMQAIAATTAQRAR